MAKLKAGTEKRKALKAMSDYIRERDHWQCYTCGKQGKYSARKRYLYDAGHLISRYWAATLFDELNVKCQCKGCNILHENDPEIFRQAWIEEHGDKAYLAMYRKSKQVVQRKAQDYINLRLYFEAKLRELEAK